MRPESILPRRTKFIYKDHIEREIIEVDIEYDNNDGDLLHCTYYVDIPFDDGDDFFEHGYETYEYIIDKGTITNLRLKKEHTKINEEMSYRGFLDIDYDDGDADTFRGIILTYGPHTKNFNTGDPLIDWYDYKKFIYNGDAAKEGIFSIGHSSSVDHWFMDTDEYIEKYLKETETGFEFISKEDIMLMSFSDMDHAIKCVISKDMNSFEDLKNYYRLNKELK